MLGLLDVHWSLNNTRFLFKRHIIGRSLKSCAMVMAVSTIHVPAEENLGDPIEIRVDIVHLTPVAAVAFPTATVVKTLA
ncbi:hypothetical protein Tco_1139157 [Tanacetum coccineum]